MSIEHKDFERTIRGWWQAIKGHPVRAPILLVILVLLIIAASFLGEIGTRLPGYFRRDGDRFHVTLSSMIQAGYPGRLFFVNERAREVSPIGLAIDVEVVNNRSTMTKIQAHVLDVYINGSWKRLHTFTVTDPLSLYWATGQDLSKAKREDFRQNALDVLARNTSLEPGQSLRGWLFYQWPEALRTPSPGPAFDRMRLTIWNSHGENQSFILKRLEAEGLSAFGRGGTIPIGEERDLSGFKLVPLME
jgi:hypothetical protein